MCLKFWLRNKIASTTLKLQYCILLFAWKDSVCVWCLILWQWPHDNPSEVFCILFRNKYFQKENKLCKCISATFSTRTSSISLSFQYQQPPKQWTGMIGLPGSTQSQQKSRFPHWDPFLLCPCSLSTKIKIVSKSVKYPAVSWVHRAISLQLILCGGVLHSRFSLLWQKYSLHVHKDVRTHTEVRSLAASWLCHPAEWFEFVCNI